MATKDELQAALDAQTALIAQLQGQLAASQAPAVAGAEFPRLLYKAGGHDKQVDHPGNVTLRVDDQDAMDAALADRWSILPILPAA